MFKQSLFIFKALIGLLKKQQKKLEFIMRKIAIATILFLSFITHIQAQETYYKTNTSKHIHTEQGYNDLKQGILKQIKQKQNLEEVYVEEVLIDSIKTNDSIIKTMGIKFISKEKASGGINRPKEKIYKYLNKELPAFTLKTIKGEEINLEALNDKPTVINLWFTRCKPCVEEIPVLNSLAKKYSDKVNFISISSDNKETINAFLKTHEFNYIHIVNASNYLNEIGSYTYPKTIFIDKNGIIKRITRGIPHIFKNGKQELGTGEEFEQYLKQILD